jgi:hypothetical protein
MRSPRHAGVLGVCEENGSLADRNVRSCLQAVLSRPGVNGLEQDFVRVEDILIGNTLDRGETIERGIDAGRERRVLKSPDNFGVFFSD